MSPTAPNLKRHNSDDAGRIQDHDRSDGSVSFRSPRAQPTRNHLTKDEFFKLDKEQLYTHWKQLNICLDGLQTNLEESNRRVEQLSTSEQRNKRKLQDVTRRENSLKIKLALRDRKLQELQAQLNQVVQSRLPSAHQLEATLIDPAINLMFEQMKSEVETAKTRAEEMQNELSAWKFTPDSNTGKRLMAKCRLLHNENEELGKDISSGWVAQLTGSLALQKKFSEEMKKSQSELDEFLLELEEEVEGMQNTIYYLQQQLRDAREERRQGCSISENVSSPPSLTETNNSAIMCNTTEQEDSSESQEKCVETVQIQPIGTETSTNEQSTSS